MKKITLKLCILLSIIGLNANAFPIFIELPNNKTVIIDAEATESIENLKSKILKDQAISLEQLQLIFNGSILENAKKIADYKITNESVLQMNILSVSKKEFLLQKTTIKLYPNPSKDYIQINGLTKKSYYFIYNTAGEIVDEGAVVDHQKINIKNLPSGMYYLNITGVAVTKITKI